jgi:hypothetical protein
LVISVFGIVSLLFGIVVLLKSAAQAGMPTRTADINS